MFYIVNEEGRLFSGFCDHSGCEVWKGHWTRAMDFNNQQEAEVFIEEHSLEGCGVIVEDDTFY